MDLEPSMHYSGNIMTIDPFLLSVLVCPETKLPVSIAGTDIVDKINARIAAGDIRNRAGKALSNKIAAALIRSDGRVLYPIIDDIPVMLKEEGIEL
jgi:uncharacterized protein